MHPQTPKLFCTLFRSLFKSPVIYSIPCTWPYFLFSLRKQTQSEPHASHLFIPESPHLPTPVHALCLPLGACAVHLWKPIQGQPVHVALEPNLLSIKDRTLVVIYLSSLALIMVISTLLSGSFPQHTHLPNLRKTLSWPLHTSPVISLLLCLHHGKLFSKEWSIATLPTFSPNILTPNRLIPPNSKEIVSIKVICLAKSNGHFSVLFLKSLNHSI